MKNKYVLTEYTISAGLPQALTIGLVSDLHECVPEKILELLRRGSPDLILIAGDTFERHGMNRDTERGSDEGFFSKLLRKALMGLDDVFGLIAEKREHDSAYAYLFLQEAGKMAPVYISLGNHEWYLLPEDLESIEASGTILLDNADSKVCVKGTEFYIGGLSSEPDFKWLDTFCDKRGYKILLCHHPEYYERYLAGKEINLILSGHAHGGQVRIGNRGLYAPGQGIFPKYTKGLYHEKLLVTTGATNTASVPRWGNPCEAVLIHME